MYRLTIDGRPVGPALTEDEAKGRLGRMKALINGMGLQLIQESN